MWMTEMWTDKSRHWSDLSPEVQAAVRVLWAEGDLRYKLDTSQRVVYDDIKRKLPEAVDSSSRRYVLDIGRQWGKDHLMSTIAVETALKSPGRREVYAAPTKTEVEEILEPILAHILMDCPPEFRPRQLGYKHRWVFPNGCRLVMVGLDKDPDKLRGPGAVAVFVTEAGFVNNLEEDVMPAVLAQMLTHPDAFQIFASTPPTTPAHPWSSKFVPQARSSGLYAHRTIYDCPRITKQQADGLMEELGGKESTRARRECLSEHVIEETLMVIPEWQLIRESSIRLVQRPPYADCYTSLDPGMSAFSAALFGYWDFSNARLVIEGEWGDVRKNTRQVFQGVSAREWQLWGAEPAKPKRDTPDQWQDELAEMEKLFLADFPTPDGSYRWARYNSLQKGLSNQPYKRVADTDMRLIADLSAEHGLVFSPTAKDNLDAAINGLRLLIQHGGLAVHPRCVQLISDLDTGTWNKQRTQFASGANGGHLDFLAALVYLYRNVERTKNPNPPPMFELNTEDRFVDPSRMRRTDSTSEALDAALSTGFMRRKRPKLR